MEHLCEEGALQGVVDYTLSELANSLMDGIHSTGPERLRVAGRLGLPQVVVPGCVDFFNQGPRDTRARALPRRARATSTTRWPRSCGSTRDEEAELGALVAERLNECDRAGARRRAHARVLARRRRGRRPLGPGRRRRVPGRARRARLRADIPFEAVDAHVDDHAFADVVAERYLSLVSETADV